MQLKNVTLNVKSKKNAIRRVELRLKLFLLLILHI